MANFWEIAANSVDHKFLFCILSLNFYFLTFKRHMEKLEAISREWKSITYNLSHQNAGRENILYLGHISCRVRVSTLIPQLLSLS